MPSEATPRSIEVRPYGEQDGGFLAAIAHRLHPSETASPLDVFAGNAGALAFYERNGYRPDHIRMAKPLV